MTAALALTSACTGSPIESTASDSASTTDASTDGTTEGSSTMTTTSGNSATGTTNGGSMSASATGSTTSSSESETATMSGTTVDPTTTTNPTTTTDTTVGTDATTDATTDVTTGVVDTSDGTTGDMTTGDMTTGEMTTGDMTTGDPPECGTSLKVTIRDFKIAHPDFQSYCCGLVTGLVKPDLGNDNKPVFNQVGNPKMLTDAATFNQWYNDVDGVNQSTSIVLDLMEIQPGLYSYNNNSFFPIDNMLFGNEGNGHNFHFTTCRLLV